MVQGAPTATVTIGSTYTGDPDRPWDGCRWSGAAAKSAINMEHTVTVRPTSLSKEQ